MIDINKEAEKYFCMSDVDRTMMTRDIRSRQIGEGIAAVLNSDHLEDDVHELEAEITALAIVTAHVLFVGKELEVDTKDLWTAFGKIVQVALKNIVLEGED